MIKIICILTTALTLVLTLALARYLFSRPGKGEGVDGFNFVRAKDEELKNSGRK